MIYQDKIKKVYVKLGKVKREEITSIVTAEEQEKSAMLKRLHGKKGPANLDRYKRLNKRKA